MTTQDMNFGHNANINKAIRKITEKPKRQLQTDKPTEHLESFDTNEIPKNTIDLSEIKRGPKTGRPLGESNLTLFLVSDVLVYGLTKMVL